MSAENLLVEIRTEELPPDISGWLARSFASSLSAELQQAKFADEDNKKNKHFATPRRLAVLFSDICAESPARQVSRRGPQVEACRDTSGAPTKALVGFMHAVGVTCENDLTEIVEKGKRYVAWEGQMAGRKLADDLAPMVEKVLLDMSVPRLMRWGDNNFRFVRPVRGVLMMHGKNTIDGTVMNIAATKTTQGHPILTTDQIAIANADDYEKTMREKGMVIVDEDARREEVRNQLWQMAKAKKHRIKLSLSMPEDLPDYLPDESLLFEVTAMCEYPTAYEGEMLGAESLPDFLVVSCMKKHQRFFPVYDQNGVLNRARYFVVADNKPEHSAPMLAGFDSVLRARLRDLFFYYTEDKKHSAEYYLERLKKVAYHGKLGSQYDRVCRLQTIARGIAKLMNLDNKQKELLEESVKLCKADLPTLVIGEYPDMEGEMAAEYFCDGETAEIVRGHNASKDEIGGGQPACHALLLADNLEKLVGMFGIGEKPTGSKDPHGLRTAAAKVVLVLQYLATQVESDKLLQVTAEAFDKLPNFKHFDFQETWNFILARMDTPHIVTTIDTQEEMARQMQIGVELQKGVLAKNIFLVADIYSRQDAAGDFAKYPEAEDVLELGKRVSNTFRKSGMESDSFSAPNVSLFEHDAEHALNDSIIKLIADTNKQTNKGDYIEALKTLALAIKPANDFYDDVMVNAEDEKVRHNRFALLNELRTLLNCVTKLS